ncbi:winged helix-turn-helix domain-containing protein [Haladaptatus litoreus]|nr:winged helix-turn-helix domain-containing protein [Haladaptatus litoreus]
MSSTTGDSTVESERETLHAITQETRFTLLQNILGHPQQLPSFKELALVNPSKSESTIYTHLKVLRDHGVVKAVELPEGERRRDFPHTFYGLSDAGRAFLDRHNVLRAEETFQTIYSQIDKPDELLKYENAPRPE